MICTFLSLYKNNNKGTVVARSAGMIMIQFEASLRQISEVLESPSSGHQREKIR